MAASASVLVLGVYETSADIVEWATEFFKVTHFRELAMRQTVDWFVNSKKEAAKGLEVVSNQKNTIPAAVYDCRSYVFTVEDEVHTWNLDTSLSFSMFDTCQTLAQDILSYMQSHKALDEFNPLNFQQNRERERERVWNFNDVLQIEPKIHQEVIPGERDDIFFYRKALQKVVADVDFGAFEIIGVAGASNVKPMKLVKYESYMHRLKSCDMKCDEGMDEAKRMSNLFRLFGQELCLWDPYGHLNDRIMVHPTKSIPKIETVVLDRFGGYDFGDLNAFEASAGADHFIRTVSSVGLTNKEANCTIFFWSIYGAVVPVIVSIAPITCGDELLLTSNTQLQLAEKKMQDMCSVLKQTSDQCNILGEDLENEETPATEHVTEGVNEPTSHIPTTEDAPQETSEGDGADGLTGAHLMNELLRGTSNAGTSKKRKRQINEFFTFMHNSIQAYKAFKRTQ